MDGAVEPPGALASTAALINNYANGIAMMGFCAEIALLCSLDYKWMIRETIRPSP
jgi:hypothetical protein